MKLVPGYTHTIGAHCESGTMKNLLNYMGVDVSEHLVFGMGSGIFFAYLPFVKTVSSFPVVALRQPIGSIVKNVAGQCGIKIFYREFTKTSDLIDVANKIIDSGKPVAVSVDLFYMKYLPGFMQVHAPAHFIALVGREDGIYAVSDPYGKEINYLDITSLERALSTRAKLAPNNLLFYIESVPARIDWRGAIKTGIKRTVNRMLMIPIMRNFLFFLGVKGIEHFASSVIKWPQKFTGFRLREGLLFLAVIFEEQGTGGGAFRLMYGSFLQEIAEKFGLSGFNEIGEKMIENGKQWREASRALVRIGKKIPVDDEAYPDWLSSNRKFLEESLGEISKMYRERAECEKKLMNEIKKAAMDI